MNKLMLSLLKARMTVRLSSSFCKRLSMTFMLSSSLVLTACGGGGGSTAIGGSSSVTISTGGGETSSSLVASSIKRSSSKARSVSSSDNGGNVSSSEDNVASESSSTQSMLSSKAASLSSARSASSTSKFPTSSLSSTKTSSLSTTSSSAASGISGLEIAPGAVSLSVGGTQQLVAVGKLSNGTLVNMFGKVTWRMSSGGTVASISPSGLLTRLTAGTAEVEATAQGKVTTLKLTDAAQNLTLNYDNSTTKWTGVNAYLWTVVNGANVEVAKWPGLAMTNTNTNGIWTYVVDASKLNGGKINVIFSNNGSNQTADLKDIAQSSTYKDGTWTAAKSGPLAQVSVIDGTLKSTGTAFPAGTVLTINATVSAARTFSEWGGASSAYIFTDPSKAEAQLVVVPSAAGSMTVQAKFAEIGLDGFEGARSVYAAKCAGCHGANGADGLNGGLNQLHVGGRYTMASLMTKISTTMPMSMVGTCVGTTAGTCSFDIANMILSNKWIKACTGASCNSNLSLDLRNLRLLTRAEYLNTVNDLFAPVAIDAAVISNIPGDSTSRNFDTASFLALDYDRTLGYQMAADAVAKQVITSKSFFSLASNCGTSPSCVVTALGKKVFRRPLTQVEIDRYTGLYDASNAGKAVIQGLLISPNFLYRSEMGTLDATTKLYRLSNYEIATLLSYTFWASTPDDALLTAAAGTTFDIKAQVTRMLADPRADRGLRRFAQGWLLNGKYGYTTFSSQTLASSFDEESIRFAMETIKANEPFKTMLTANYTYANPELAKYYGSSAVASGWAKSTFSDSDPRSRTGILGHGSFLSTRTSSVDNPSPIKRGLFVRGVLMCQELPPPQKAGVAIPRVPEDSNRTANAKHTSDPACASCHQYIDGIGFGFEKFGSDSRYRTQETLGNGLKQLIDASGTIKSLNSTETTLNQDSPVVAYNTVPELATIIAESGQASACYSRQFYRYVVGREVAADDASDAAIIPAYSSRVRAGGGMRDMLSDLALNPSFILRR